MRRGLVMGMVLGLLVGAAPAMADTLDDVDDAARRLGEEMAALERFAEERAGDRSVGRRA